MTPSNCGTGTVSRHVYPGTSSGGSERVGGSFVPLVAGPAAPAGGSPPKAREHRRQGVTGHVCGGEREGVLQVAWAWATGEGLVLGQVAAEEKSNETRAIPAV